MGLGVAILIAAPGMRSYRREKLAEAGLKSQPGCEAAETTAGALATTP